jgi:hypothetical protein
MDTPTSTRLSEREHDMNAKARSTAAGALALLTFAGSVALTACSPTSSATPSTATASAPSAASSASPSVVEAATIACPWAPPVPGKHRNLDRGKQKKDAVYTDQVTYIGTCAGPNRVATDPSDVPATITVDISTITIDAGEDAPLIISMRAPAPNPDATPTNVLVSVANEGLREVGAPLTLTWTDGDGLTHTTRVTYADPERQETVHRAIHAFSNTLMVC